MGMTVAERRARYRARHPEKIRAEKAAYRARKAAPKRARGRKPKALVPFVGVDGEGAGKDRKGRQHYMLLSASGGDFSDECHTGKPLTTKDCLNFICDLPDRTRAILIGFSFGYDTTMILRDLTKAKRDDLFTERTIRLDDKTIIKGYGQYTWFGDFGIQYRAHQYLRVCRAERTSHVMPDGRLLPPRTRAIPGTARTIYEGFGFFQKSFVNALADFDVGTKRERARIAKTKNQRANFSRMTREVRDYCLSECAMLAEMMEKLREGCLSAPEGGMMPRTWNGAGKLAEALHIKRGTIETKALVPPLMPSGVLMFAEAAYYGGRFEVRLIGRIACPVYEYDLASAYPASMRGLPCLEHGRWRYLDGDAIRALHRADPQALYVAGVRYHHTEASGHRRDGMCGLPHRQTGREDRSRRQYADRIAWPLRGQGTYWSPEIRSAELLGARLGFGSGWAYSTACQCDPFDWIEPLYRHRKSLGKSAAGYPIKLGINSLYGKLAQSVGTPRFRNMVWAGLVTARTRAMLNQAMAANPGAIAMVATDGLYATAPLDLPLGGELGAWEETIYPEGLFIVQPGVYWGAEGLGKLKTRGVSAKWFPPDIRAKFERVWSEFSEADRAAYGPAMGGIPGRAPLLPSLDIPIRLFTGLRLAQARGKPDTAGCWVDDTREIRFDWRGKRFRHVWSADGAHVITDPMYGGPDWISASHQAEPVADPDDAEIFVYEDQPDFLMEVD
jgi:DNA polymerase type B, organellar and viral